jgi:YegS/Rv2252/BmrU family lipid kinase
MRRRFYLVYNPVAGRSRAAALERVVRELEAAKAEVVHCTATSSEAARADCVAAARSGQFDALVAAGGDGTIRQVAAAVRDSGQALGVIPLGTGNVLSHELALPRRRAKLIAEMLLNGPVEHVDMATANGEPFLLMAGAGFDGRIVAGLDHGIKNWLGKTAYVMPTLRTLARPLDLLRVTIDGQSTTATWVVVTNARHFGGGFVITPGMHLRQSGLQAIVFRSRSRTHLIGQLIAIATGRHASKAASGADDVGFIDCERVDVDADAPVPAQIDGDDFGTTPLSIRRGGGRVAVIVPSPDKA